MKLADYDAMGLIGFILIVVSTLALIELMRSPF